MSPTAFLQRHLARTPDEFNFYGYLSRGFLDDLDQEIKDEYPFADSMQGRCFDPSKMSVVTHPGWLIVTFDPIK